MEGPAGSMPAAARRCRSCGSASAVTAAWLMRRASAGSIPFGPCSTLKVTMSKPGKPCSARLGTSGSSGWRPGEVTASAREPPSRPASRTWGHALASTSQEKSISALRIASSTAEPPR